MELSNDERIDRMEAEGIVTPQQAELLRVSLSPQTVATSNKTQHRFNAALLTAGLIILIIAAVSIAIAIAPTGGPVEVQDVSSTLNSSQGVGAMSRSIMTFLILILFVALGVVLFLWAYNGLVNREEQVFAAWGQVESNLQRRADLTPRLVETISRYLRHEKKTFENVAQIRTQDTAAVKSAIDELADAIKQSAEQLQRGGEHIIEDEKNIGALADAQARMDRSIHTLMATAEAYPELRASDQFLELQAQFEGTENRLNVTRMRFNELVGEYNSAIRRVPAALVATVGNFRRKAYFQADQKAHNASQLKFD